jgi:deoxyribonucleoside regulator
VLVQSGFLTAAEMAALRAKGAVGDLLGHFIDARGGIVDPALDARTVGLDPVQCREKPVSIAVSAGAAKHRAVLACLRARFMTILVTDEATTTFLLDHAHE